MHERLPIRENKAVLFLASLLVLVVALAISQAGWTDDLGILVYVGAGAIVIGLLISQSLLPSSIAHIFSAVIGVGWSFWVVSQLLPDRFTWRLRWDTMIVHIANWYSLAREGGVIYDNLMFILQMSFVIWTLGYLTIWFLFRSGKIWSAIIPAGIVLLINLYYAPKDLTTWFITYLLLALLLIVRFNLFEYESRWRIEHVHFRSDISFDFLRNGLIFSVIVIALAWFTPAVSEDSRTTVFDRFDRHWRGVQEEWNRLFAGLNYKPETGRNPNAYTQAHALGGARVLSEQPVMYVDAPGGRYWRAVVYDEYDGNGWVSNDDQDVRFDESNRSLSLPFYEGREPFTQTYTILQDGLYILYAMAQPLSINLSTMAKTNFVRPEEAVNAEQRRPWAGRSGPWVEEITYIESDARLQAGEAYQVVSQMSVATKEQLRAEATDYPTWIEERYLEIPDTTSRRVKDLAEQITQHADNAYDKAEAIERYLRNELEYNERLDAPPPGRDKVDYILFEARQAYCDYYATSMIVMLRSLGIPARFAAGFARGQEETLDNQERIYLVRNLDAHSWVEAYFPTYGWIEFEPTSAQPTIFRRTDAMAPFRNPGRPDDFLEEDIFDQMDRLEEEDLQALGELPDINAAFYRIPLPFFGDIRASKTIVNWSIAGLFVLVVGSMAWRAYGPRARQEFSSGDVYFAMLRLAHWMGLAKRPSQTPYEHASILAKNLPPIETEVNFITDEFVRNEFSPRPTTEETKFKLLAAWSKIRPALYRGVFDRRMPKIRLPFRW